MEQGVAVDIARMRARLRGHAVTPTTYNNQLIETKNEPVLGEPTRLRRTCTTVVSFSDQLVREVVN